MIENLQKSCLSTGEINEISIYKGELTPDCLIKSMKKIKDSFPNLTPGFFDILQDRLKDNNFCNERLTDAINNVIDTCIYPNPTIANFISYDRKYKIQTYNDMCKMVEEFGRTIWEDYNIIDMPSGKKGWVKK